ncbi:Beta-lactamase [Folsomia candida]|uniref:Beta-lactamase n=1 Tax=Folsomia candida TaxID=158441 RepID=A0A226DIH3_FOLCA|nr:Beta-lactamase [Folsomia candida]
MDISILVYFFFASIFIPFISTQNVIPPETQHQIDLFISNVMNQQNVPALAISIIKNNGELLYKTGYGQRDRENRLPADSDTLFSIGSLTKSFTAVIAVKFLHENFPELGQSVLDTPIRTLAPSYDFVLGDRYRSGSVTFRDLLAHRVCYLPEYTGMWVQAYNDSREFFYRQRYSLNYCAFRNAYLYNNGLIAIAGDIIAHLANSTYEDMLSDLLLSIGMTNTTWVKESDDHNNMMQRAVPYYWKDGVLNRYNPELMKGVVLVNAAGGILSSASDMMKYMQFHLNLGQVGDNQIIPAEVMNWLYTPSSLIASGTLKSEINPDSIINLNIAYGLCLDIGVYDGWLRIGHGGYLPPSESLMHLYPELGLGVFIAMSGPGTLRSTSMPNSWIQAQLFEILRGAIKQDVGRFDSFSNKIYTAAPLDLMPLADLSRISTRNQDTNSQAKISPDEAVGTYGSGFNGEMIISFKNNSAGIPQLYWEYGKWGLAWLVQISESNFSIDEWASDFWMMYWANQRGMTNLTLEFADMDNIRYLAEGAQGSTNFTRGLKIDDLPEVPWAPDSCEK